MLALTVAAAPAVQAQTLTVLHSFTGGRDGASPLAGLTTDEGGNLYGTTNKGGAGYGTVFKLGHSGSGWTFTPLYSFQNGPDGANPVARVVFGPDHTLYGTTEYGGETGYCTNGGCGTAFNLRPPPTACRTALCPWMEAIVHRFTSGGVFPESELLFDSAGNIYGTALDGGSLVAGGGNGCYPSCGAVYELTPSSGGWTETVLYNFTGYQYGDDGANPVGGLIFDNAGNLFGTTFTYGNCGYGIAFELTPSGSKWAEHLIHDFCSPHGAPAATLIRDASGNLYGTDEGLPQGYGTIHGGVFKLIPANGGYTFQSLYTFPEFGGGPAGSLLMDNAGNLYGTTITGGGNPLGKCSNGCGRVFELAYSNGNYTYIELYDFTGGNDGAAPYSNLVMDAYGNLYGTTSAGGVNGDGTVFEFTP
jgi:hypothetical protein